MANQSTTPTAKEGKHLSFALGKEEYGVEILQIREIIGLMEITTMPKVPEYVKGVINLRGKIIPVIDLRLKFGMPAIDSTKETCIIVLNIGHLLMGILVDRVCEVLNIKQADIEPPPSFGTKLRSDLITGMGKVGNKVKILLNIEKILTEDSLLAQEVEEENSVQ